MSIQLPVSQQTHISSEAQDAGTAISHGMLAYFRGRFSNKIHELVLEKFAAQEREGRTSRAELARKIRRKPEQITRWLGSPGNWTLDTLSDLLLGMGLEPEVSARSIASERVSNLSDASHALWETHKFPLTVHVQTHEEVARDIANGYHKSIYLSFYEPTNDHVYRTIEVPLQSPPQPTFNVFQITKKEHEHGNQ